VRLLLDTHALIWAAAGSLGRDAQSAIEDGAEVVFVSAATVWEIEIKRALDRLRVPDDVAGLVEQSGFQPLAIGFEHAREAGRLPPLHGDPFDRMLVAQARVEGLTLATADEAIRRYEVAVLDIVRA
jgi:PIN domain nuclease of toxin-antitoxin system